MSIDNLGKIANILVERFKIRFSLALRKEKEGLKLILRPEGLSVAEGFQISVLVGWKRLTIVFSPENKAGLLVIAMGQADAEKKAVFSSIADNITMQKGTINFLINGKLVDPTKPVVWPEYWQKVDISLKSPILDLDGDLSENEDLEELLIRWSSIFLGMLIPLLPLQENYKRIEDEQGNNIECLPEGAQINVIVNRYERSQINRQACISIYGNKCQICGFDFGEKYGAEGEGYIEVHHITPVSQLGDGYLVNPVKDLIPLCSNCHSMIHRQYPPYTVKEVKDFIKNSELS